MDLNAQAARAELDLESYKTLLGTFLEATGPDLAELSRAVDAADSGAAASVAHHIKGAAANLELEEIRAAALAAELAGKAGSVEGIAAHLAVISAQLEEIRAALG
jgi:HPt (histidine-containing phosphotransfer) domain-containing protein